MNQDETKTLIRARLHQAEEALGDGQHLLEVGRGNRTIVNRAYYAAFYSALALLKTIGQTPRKHSGVLSLFDREFVKSGIFPKEYSRQFHQLFDMRQEDDYLRMDVISKKEAEKALSLSEAFVKAIRDYLLQHQYL